MARNHKTKDLKVDEATYALLQWAQEKEQDVYPIQTLRRLIRLGVERMGYTGPMKRQVKEGE